MSNWNGTDDQPLGNDGELVPLADLMLPHFERVKRENAERDERRKAREAEDAKRGTFVMEFSELGWLERYKLATKLSADDVAKLNEACKHDWKVVNV